MKESEHQRDTERKEESGQKNASFNSTSLPTTSKEKLNFLSSKQLDYQIKKLSKPDFLGSIHFAKDVINKQFHSVENLMQGELDTKINNSLKNSMFNPVTKILIFITILFNIMWILYFYI